MIINNKKKVNLKQLLELIECDVMIMRSGTIILRIYNEYIEDSEKLLSDELLSSDVITIASNNNDNTIQIWLAEVEE